MAVDLTPSEAMATAAQRGLDLAAADEGARVVEPAAKARARKIAEKAGLTPAHVKRMHTFFAEHARPVKDTLDYLVWQLWGGDAGKAWAAGKVKQLSGAGVNMDEDKQEFAELFFADSQTTKIEADDEGLIWKPMLPVGVWKIGPNGRPLKVVPGKSPDQRQAIGMQDVIEAFNSNAVPHVTVPLSHEDRVDENTGYIRKLKIGTHNGVKTLFGGHHFTDKKAKQKVMEGSIANTSVGLEFDYVRKDDGKKFPVVLRHNALTNRPWLGRKLAPFGLDESEADNYVVMCGEYSEQFTDESQEVVDLWDNALTLGEVRDALAVLAENCEVMDVATDRVLLKEDDKTYVAKFSIEDGDVVLVERDEWVERKVEMTESNPAEDDHTEVVDDKSTSGEPSKITTMSEKDNTTTQEGDVPEEKKDPKETPGTATVVNFAESEEYKAQQAEIARLRAQNDQLAKKDRERDANDFITGLKNIGLDEEHGFTEFLKFTRNILLSDEGDATIMLSEEGTDAAPRPVTAAGLVRELLAKLPTKDGKIAMQLAEQHTDPLGQSQGEKPEAKAQQGDPGDPNANLSERIQAADEWFDEAFGVSKSTTTQES